jgi:acetyl esterase/lipase
LVAAALLFSGCSPLRLLNAVIPTSGYSVVRDLAYGAHPSQKLDLYIPDRPADQIGGRPFDVVVFIHGGSWQAGDRDEYQFVGQALASKGFIAVVADYRLYPDVRFPDFVADAAAATRWTRDHIAARGGNPARLFVMGHSAGAHIAALLALDASYLTAVGMAPRDLRGVIGLAGPYDFLPLRSNTLKIIFGPESERWRSQPIRYVDGQNPPMLLLAGNNDTMVDPGNTTRLAAAIRAKGGVVDAATLMGFNHGQIMTSLAAPLRGDGQVLNRIETFVRAH